MTKRETTSLLIKLMGIYCLVQIAPSLFYVLGFFSTIKSWQSIGTILAAVGMAFILPLVWIGFCVLIICKSDSIARRLYREDADASQLTSLEFHEVQTLGFSFIGLILIVQSLPDIISLLASIRMQQIYKSSSWTAGDYYLNTLPRLLAVLTQFVLGWILFLKPKGLVNLWKKSQAMRYEKVPSDIPPSGPAH